MISVIRIDSAPSGTAKRFPERAYPYYGRRKPEVLTPRDLSVIGVIMRDPGATRREIGAELSVSEDCIKAHAKRIYRVLGVQTRAELVAVLMEQAADRRAA